MLIGYIRVSSKDQNENRQIVKMKNLGIENRFIFIDRQSGKDFDRPQYQAMKKIIRKNDLIYLDALDRLGRNYDAVIKEWKYITRELEADIVVLENEFLFDSRKFKQMGNLGKLLEDQFLSLLSYIADQERKKIRQRQKEGIALAKSKGKHLGRPRIEYPLNWREVYSEWKKDNITAVNAQQLLNLKPGTFYNMVKRYEEKQSL